MARELDYVTHLGDHDPTPCSITDFLCYLNRSLSFFRPQFLICKMQLIALPWRVPCCQVMKKWWWWGQTGWSQKQKWCESVPSTRLALREDSVCHTGQITTIQEHPTTTLPRQCKG